jgi:hypothetical protein
MTRVDAEASCVDAGMDLVAIEDSNEHDFISVTTTNTLGVVNTGPWIGLQDEDLDGLFAWNDGSSLTSSQWCTNHPLNPGTREYVFLELQSGPPCWAANGTSLTATLGYICEF